MVPKGTPSIGMNRKDNLSFCTSHEIVHKISKLSLSNTPEYGES